MSSFFVIAFSWCAPRECAPDEAKSIGCKVTKPYNENSTKVQYLCFTDIEEYVDDSPKNIPYCITTYPRTWTVDTKPFSLFFFTSTRFTIIAIFQTGLSH